MKILILSVLMSLTSCQTFKKNDGYPYNQKIKSITGLKVPVGYKHEGVKFYSGVGLPDEFDWRDKGLTDVENQGSCGSCWAMATASVLEDNIKLTTGKDIDLSEQYLVDCVAEANGCGGGWAAHDYHFKKGYKGAILENEYPYQARDGRCQGGKQIVDKIVKWQPVNNDVESIKHAIFNYGPVWTAVCVDSNFHRYRSGLFNTCQRCTINHAVTLVGWTKSGWILKNSWGYGWGDDGYMEIAYGCNNVGEGTSHIVYEKQPDPMPDPDPTPTPTPNPDPWDDDWPAPRPTPTPDPTPDPEPCPPCPDPDDDKDEDDDKLTGKCQNEDKYKTETGQYIMGIRVYNKKPYALNIFYKDSLGYRRLNKSIAANSVSTIKTQTKMALIAVKPGKEKCLDLFYPRTVRQDKWIIK
jgi:hypothetical protein